MNRVTVSSALLLLYCIHHFRSLHISLVPLLILIPKVQVYRCGGGHYRDEQLSRLCSETDGVKRILPRTGRVPHPRGSIGRLIGSTSYFSEVRVHSPRVHRRFGKTGHARRICWTVRHISARRVRIHWRLCEESGLPRTGPRAQTFLPHSLPFRQSSTIILNNVVL